MKVRLVFVRNGTAQYSNDDSSYQKETAQLRPSEK